MGQKPASPPRTQPRMLKAGCSRPCGVRAHRSDHLSAPWVTLLAARHCPLLHTLVIWEGTLLTLGCLQELLREMLQGKGVPSSWNCMGIESVREALVGVHTAPLTLSLEQQLLSYSIAFRRLDRDLVEEKQQWVWSWWVAVPARRPPSPLFKGGASNPPTSPCFVLLLGFQLEGPSHLCDQQVGGGLPLLHSLQQWRPCPLPFGEPPS